jgi:hypothetical protein
MHRYSALMLAAGLACTPLNAMPNRPKGEIIVAGPSVIAPGDSLNYRLSWGAGSRAVAYGVRVTASPPANWAGLPDGAVVPGTTASFTAISATWDSVRFEAKVWSLDSRGRVSKDTARVAWSVVRGPGGPGPIQVDSSLIVIGLNLLPDTAYLVFDEQRQFCVLVEFHGGNVALPAEYDMVPECVSAIATLPASRRALAKQQAVADTLCIRFRTTDPQGSIADSQSCGGVTQAQSGWVDRFMRWITGT